MAELRADGLRRCRADSRIVFGLAYCFLQLCNLVAAGACMGFGGLAANNPDRNRLGRRRAALSIPAVERDQSVGFRVIGGAGTARHIVRHHLESAGGALPVVGRGGLWVGELLLRERSPLPFLSAHENEAPRTQNA